MHIMSIFGRKENQPRAQRVDNTRWAHNVEPIQSPQGAHSCALAKICRIYQGETSFISARPGQATEQARNALKAYREQCYIGKSGQCNNRVCATITRES